MMRYLLCGTVAGAALSLAIWAACGFRGERPMDGVVALGEEPAPSGPRIFFTDIEAGPVTGGPDNLGVPIAIYGKGFGSARRASRVTIGGAEVASYLVWGASNAHNKMLDMIVVQPGPGVSAGPVVVSVNGRASNSDYSFSANSGKVYYIATNGSDGSSCSQAAPCATILHVVGVMRPGDTVLVRAGTYAEGEIWIRAAQGGAVGQSKVIRNYPGEEVDLTNASRDFIIDADYITVSGLNFKNGKALNLSGWASRDQRGARFINNTFMGTIGWAAIDTQGHDHLVAGNVCEVSGSTAGTMGHCYYVSQGRNVRILYNIAAGAPGYGLHIYDERRDASDFQRIIRDVLVEGNVFRGSTQRSGMIISMTDAGGYGNYVDNITVRNNIITSNNHAGMVIAGTVRNLKIYNNTFYQNGKQGIYVDNDAKISGVDARNNLIYQSSNANCRADCSVLSLAHIQVGAAAQNVTINNNSYHPGSPSILGGRDANAVTGSVQFADAASLDFHILSGSAVIDRGLTLGDVPVDWDGRRRPQGAAYDIGAYEFQSRTPVLTSVVNSASLLATPLTPGGMVTAFGWNLGPEDPVAFQAGGTWLERQLSDTRALFDDTPAPLLFVQENQVNALVPYEVVNRASVRVEIEVGGQRSNAVVLSVASTAPGIFTLDCSGKGQGAILDENHVPNLVSNPARKGSAVILYATGLGQTEPMGIDGLLVHDVLPIPLAGISMNIGGIDSDPLYVRAVPGLAAGLFEICARIRDEVASGDAVPVFIRAGDAVSQPGVTMAIL